jgi:nucleoside-diphosphate-sugar epimerase
MYGDGSQVRDFTYISDVVQANLLSAAATIDPGQCVNISGGSSATLLHVAGLIERISGRPLRLEQVGPQLGDVKRTGGGITKAATLLQWAPNVPVEAGIALEFEWMRDELATDEHEVDEPFG